MEVLGGRMAVEYFADVTKDPTDYVNMDQTWLEMFIAHFLSSTVFIIFLFQYLMGYIERGVWATYSDTSWEFRATYVSIELRLAAYFWFKFRAWPTPASSLETGRKRSRAELIGTPSVSPRNQRNKFEPRLKAYVQNGDKNMKPIWLGEYDSRYEAEVVFWIGAYYYDRWDRFNDGVYPRCMAINLPLLPPNLSVEGKRAWVREEAEVSLTRRRRQDPGASAEHYQAGSDVPVMLSGAVEERSQEGSVAEPPQGAGFGDPVTEPRTVEGGLPIDDSLQSSPPPDPRGDIESMHEEFMTGGVQQPNSAGIDVGQRDLDVSADNCFPWSSSTPDVASGHGVGNEGQNLLGTCRDQSIYNQQDVQHLQQNHERAIDLEGGDVLEAGGILQEDETEGHYVLRRSVVEPHQGAGYGDLVTESRTVEEEGLRSIDDSLQSSLPTRGDLNFTVEEITGVVLQQSDSTGIDMSQPDLDVSVDDYFLGSSSTPDVASGHGVGIEGQNLCRTYQDSNACQQQDIQDLRHSLGSAIVLGGAGAEVGAMPQGETDLAHCALRESANHTNVVDAPVDADEHLDGLRFTDKIRSTFRELRGQGWGFEMQPLGCNEPFVVEFSKRAGRKRPNLTSSNFYALEEIHEQGYKVILEPLSDATNQDSTGGL